MVQIPYLMSALTEIIYSRTKLKSALVIVAYLLVMIGTAVVFSKYVDQDSLQETVKDSGVFGIIIYSLIEIVYVTFTPLLNTFILIASGYIFGGHLGFLVNFFSTATGLFLIVILVHKYGRPLLQRLASPRFYQRFDHITQKMGPMILLVVYIVPFTPDDELTYILAAGPVEFKRFVLPVLFGTLAKSAYSYIVISGHKE